MAGRATCTHSEQHYGCSHCHTLPDLAGATIVHKHFEDNDPRHTSIPEQATPDNMQQTAQVAALARQAHVAVQVWPHWQP